jgi:hypothetical protein
MCDVALGAQPPLARSVEVAGEHRADARRPLGRDALHRKTKPIGQKSPSPDGDSLARFGRAAVTFSGEEDVVPPLRVGERLPDRVVDLLDRVRDDPAIEEAIFGRHHR